jgi:hypothetical protein
VKGKTMAAILLIGLTGSLVLAMLAWQWYGQTLADRSGTTAAARSLARPNHAVPSTFAPQRLSPFRSSRSHSERPHRAA